MPVQPDCYSRVKLVCDRLAVLASCCHEIEFAKRLDFLEALCRSWSYSDDQQTPVSGSVDQTNDTEVCKEHLSQPSKVDTVTYSNDNCIITDDGTSLARNGNKQASECFPTVASKLQNVFLKQSVPNCVTYNCSFDCKQFSPASQPTRRTPVQSRHIEKCPYVCCFCCERFRTSTQLLGHLKRHDYSIPVKITESAALEFVTNKDGCDVNGASIKDLLTCKDRRKQFSAELQSHVRSDHKVPRHFCPHCGTRCKSVHGLRSHLRRSHSDAVNKYFCDACGQCFGRLLDLRDHRLTHHRSQTCNGTDTLTKSDTDSTRSMCCKDCGADNFKTLRSLTVHRRTHHGTSLSHRCCHCHRQFLYASDLRKHERRHTGQRPHVCTVCDKGFFQRVDLDVHSRRHRGEAPLTCSVCNKWMSSMTGLRAHMHIHRPNAPDNVCIVCHKEFSYLSSLRAHLKRQHGVTAVNVSMLDCWRCVKCGAQLDNQSLRDHINSCRSSKNVAENHADPPHKSSHRDSIDNNAVCSITDKTDLQSCVNNNVEVCENESLGHHDKVTQHQPEHTNHIIGNGNNPDVVGSLTADLANDDTHCSSLVRRWQLKYPGRKIEPHTCTTCGKQFLQGVQLRKHMVKHASADDDNGVEFPYTCYVCRRHFLFANDLRRHLITHSNDRPYSCVVCTRPFKREDDVTKHMKTHGDVRPYKCAECSECLQSSSKLRKHMRNVHGDRFECTHCRAFFAKRSLLAKHKRELHADEDDAVVVGAVAFMCDRCGKSFSHESDLRDHMYISHSRRRAPVHICAWCSRQFASTSHLASHERIHTGDRPFTCDTCGKQFTQSGSLNVHRRTHVEPQPFPCRVCGQRFASKQYAKKHHAMKHPANTGV